MSDSKPLPRWLSETALLASAILSFASLEGEALAQCVAPGAIQTLTDFQGFRWDVAENGQIQDGGLVGGPGDSFDNGFALRVNGSYFPQATRTTRPSGELVHGPIAVGGVTVTRRVFASGPNGGLGFARFTEIFDNPGATPVVVT